MGLLSDCILIFFSIWFKLNLNNFVYIHQRIQICIWTHHSSSSNFEIDSRNKVCIFLFDLHISARKSAGLLLAVRSSLVSVQFHLKKDKILDFFLPSFFQFKSFLIVSQIPARAAFKTFFVLRVTLNAARQGFATFPTILKFWLAAHVAFFYVDCENFFTSLRTWFKCWAFCRFWTVAGRTDFFAIVFLDNATLEKVEDFIQIFFITYSMGTTTPSNEDFLTFSFFCTFDHRQYNLSNIPNKNLNRTWEAFENRNQPAL